MSISSGRRAGDEEVLERLAVIEGWMARHAVSIIADPVGEITISVPEEVVDPYATVLAVDLA